MEGQKANCKVAAVEIWSGDNSLTLGHFLSQTQEMLQLQSNSNKELSK